MPNRYDREYYLAHKELIDSRNKEWTEKHKVYYKRYHLNRRLRALEILGNICVVCGFEDKRALQIDHINGGGSLERKTGLHSTKLHNYIIENPEEAKLKYQILCANCNWIKKYKMLEFRK